MFCLPSKPLRSKYTNPEAHINRKLEPCYTRDGVRARKRPRTLLCIEIARRERLRPLYAVNLEAYIHIYIYKPSTYTLSPSGQRRCRSEASNRAACAAACIGQKAGCIWAGC